MTDYPTFYVSKCHVEHDLPAAARIISGDETATGEEFDLLVVMADEIDRLRAEIDLTHKVAYQAGIEAAARKVEQGLQIARANEAFAPSEVVAKEARIAALSRAAENIRSLPMPEAVEPTEALDQRFVDLLQRWSDRSLRLRRSLGLAEGDTTDIEDCRRELIEALGARSTGKSPSFRAAFPLCESSISKPTEDEVERAARAMIAEMSRHLDEDDPTDWADLIEDDRRAAMQVALAAITAARSRT